MEFTATAVVRYDLSLGTLLVSSWINWSLYAIEVAQLVKYYSRFGHSDSILNRSLVSIAFVCDTLTVGAICAAVYLYTITNFGNAAFSVSQPWPLPTYVVGTGVAAVVCQAFLTLRIFRLTKSIVYPIFFGACIACGLAGAIGSAIGLSTFKTLADRIGLNTFVTLWLVTSAATDVLLAGILVWHFRGVKSTTAYEETDSLISKLSKSAIQTGSATATVALLAFITYEVRPTTNLAVMFGMLLGRIYTLTMLFNLNQRTSIRNEVNGMSTHGGGMKSMTRSKRNSRDRGHGGVNIQRDVHTHIESTDPDDMELGHPTSYSVKTSKYLDSAHDPARPHSQTGSVRDRDIDDWDSKTDSSQVNLNVVHKSPGNGKTATFV